MPMRGLNGDFGTMPLKDLVVYLGNKRASGTLRFERGNIRKRAVLREGHVVSTSSNEPREYLGQFLINMGHITEEQFNKAYQTQQETRVLQGKILVMIGLVSEQTVLDALSLKARETLLGPFQWPDGTFHYDPSEPEEDTPGLELKIDLLDIYREGEFRETAWQAIRAVFPSGAVQLELIEGNAPPPQLGSLDEKLLDLVRGGASIDEIILSLHATDFFVYQRLYALYRRDAVRVVEGTHLDIDLDAASAPLSNGAYEIKRAPSPVGDSSGPDEILQHAEAFLEAGDYSGAEALARRGFELLGTPEAADLLQRAEQMLFAQLRDELMEGDRVPKLLLPPSKLKAMQLSAPERYLLSRIDGERDIASIIHVSPLQPLEALKLFSGFISNGLVKL